MLGHAVCEDNQIMAKQVHMNIKYLNCRDFIFKHTTSHDKTTLTRTFQPPSFDTAIPQLGQGLDLSVLTA